MVLMEEFMMCQHVCACVYLFLGGWQRIFMDAASFLHCCLHEQQANWTMYENPILGAAVVFFQRYLLGTKTCTNY